MPPSFYQRYAQLGGKENVELNDGKFGCTEWSTK